MIALYDAFEAVAEALLGKVSSLMVSWQGDALVLAMAEAPIPALNSLPVLARVREVEGILYLDLFAEAKGGVRS